MPVWTIVTLAAVVNVFAIFVCLSAWEQLQTRQPGAPVRVKAASRPKRRAV